MLVEWRFEGGNYYTDVWIRRCEQNKVSPNAVYEARPFYVGEVMFVKILTKQGLRLMSISAGYVKVLKPPKINKQLKDYL
jgi:hypothetical protein